MKKGKTKDRIVGAASRLFYEQGFERTSFADIAGATSLSRGNFYHHFKSKDEILDAVICLRLADTHRMLEKWELDGEMPVDRIRSFVNILVMNKNKIKRYGCPVGTLCSELAKLNHVARSEANGLFSLFRNWLRRQFELLGRPDDADDLAMHVLQWSQGVATLANAFRDEKFVQREVRQMNEWLNHCASNVTAK